MKFIDYPKRRVDGKDNWKKDKCPYVKTGWAWWYSWDGGKSYGCLCHPCKPPEHKEKGE